MKKILYLLILFNILIPIKSAEASMGYIDVNYILKNSKDGKKLIQELNIIKNENENLINLKKKHLDAQQTKLNNIKNITQEEEFQKKANELNLEIKEFNDFKKDKILSFEKIKDKKLDDFFDSLNEILINYIKINDINIIIDKENIIIANSSLDLTNEILDLINKD